MSHWVFATNRHPGVSTGYANPNNPLSGVVRYNSSINAYEINDSSSWVSISTFTNVNTHPDLDENMKWVAEQRLNEQKIKNLAETHPAVRNAVKNLEKAREQLELIVTLSTDHTQ